eukprot:m.13567 g.13567  ORF g.13567 m.13567 type:complete len:145 (-) comp5960_c0_seq1:103-537(-)
MPNTKVDSEREQEILLLSYAFRKPCTCDSHFFPLPSRIPLQSHVCSSSLLLVGIYAYVILKDGVSESDDLKKELIQTVRENIGAIARPDIIQFTSDVPKTRSGKIMRRILRKVAKGKADFGDTSTLSNPEIIDVIIQGHKQLVE